MPTAPLSAFTPYPSFIVLELRAAPHAGAVDSFLTRMQVDLGFHRHSSGRKLLQTRPEAPDGTTEVAFILFSETSSQSWIQHTYSGIAMDLNHHFLLTCRQGKYVCVSSSHPNALRVALDRISEGDAKYARFKIIDPARLSMAFVDEDDIRALWLEGLHAKSTTKADRKALTGSGLQDMLNPLEDQTFGFSSIRTRKKISIPALSKTEITIGLTPTDSRIWFPPASGWIEYKGISEAILTSLRASISANQTIPILAQETYDDTGISEAYDVSIGGFHLLSSRSTISQSDAEVLELWENQGTFEVTGESSLKFSVEASLNGQFICDLKIQPLLKRPRADFVVGNPTVATGDARQRELGARLTSLVRRAPEFLTIYYESGHTIANARAFSIRWRDVKFGTWKFENLSGAGIDVSKEKPLVGEVFVPTEIGKQDSLFCWIVKTFTTGWLACDDGAGETADFVHYDPVGNAVTLFHAKGSKSRKKTRRIGTTDYEIVVSQALKNLRFVDRISIAEALKRTSAHGIAKFAWKDGAAVSDRSGMIAALQAATKPPAKHVVILQARTTKTRLAKTRASQLAGTINSDTLRMVQLDTVLVAAEAACRAVGATMQVIIDDI